MPDTSRPLGETIMSGLAGLVYDDPITLWGSALAFLATAALVWLGALPHILVGIVLTAFVWAAIGTSLRRAVRKHHRR